MVESFFTTRHAEAPTIPLVLHLSFLLLVFLFMWWAGLERRNRIFVSSVRAIQWIQVTALYGWYLLCDFQWSISLPLYHCRMAMFALLLLPDKNRWKPYFALLGCIGAIISFVYPVLDTYAWPHLTQFSFVIGHYALLMNAWIYLLNHYQEARFNSRHLVVFVLVMNSVLLVANQVTGGDYGFLRRLPLIQTTQPLLNFLIVSSLLILFMGALGQGVTHYLQGRTNFVKKEID